MKIIQLSSGNCECIYEPRGECGLEGYSRGDNYKFEKWKKIHVYYRIWPNIDCAYYETCGPVEFTRYFKIVKEYPVVKIKDPDKP